MGPFGFIADGYTFANSDGSGYANESKVEYQGGDYYITDVNVVPAPQTIDEQPTDLKFYLTSRAADKYVKFVVSTIEEWRGTQFRLTFEKKDGTVINETAVTAFEKQEITLSAVNFNLSDSGSYRVKLELKGYVLYSNTFNITVTECEHPGYDMSTGKCTRCGCDLAAAIVKGETTRGYVNFDDALTATQTDENKGCVLWLLTDVTKKITVSAGNFKFGINSHTIGGLNVAKTAKLNIFGGTVNGAVIVAKNANLIASAINFMGTVNDNGNMSSFINCVFGQTLNARGSNTNFNGCTVKDALTAIDNAEKAADEVGKLPSLDDVKFGNKDDVERVKEILGGLTENEKTMLGNDAAEKVKALGEKIAALEKISFAPSIIEGAGQSWSLNSGKNALFRSNAEFDEFVKVLVDGKELDKSNYIAYAGSTVVELKAAHLKTLSAGTHTLSVVSRNGQADITFTIEKERKNNSPKTGENNDVVMWIALLFISSGVMTGIGAAKKSKKKK